MYSVRPMEAADEAAWDEFVHACPQAGFFHLSGWKRVIEGSFRQKCPFLLAERGGSIGGVLPLVWVKSRLFGNRLVSTGWCVGGGAAAMDTEAAAALDAEALALLERLPADYLEIRDPLTLHEDPGWVRREGLYASFEAGLAQGEEAVLKQIPRKQRAVVRKALDSSLSNRVDTDIDDFYRLYSLSMRNLGTPVFSADYFRALMREFKGQCDILTVLDGTKPLSSVMNFRFRDRVMPYYTGADPAARGLGAADLMYFQVMRRAAEQGYSCFDFGRSKVGTGPYAFKKNWGFTPRPVVHEFRLKDGKAMPDVNPNNPKYRLLIAAWQRLPLPLANLIGPVLGRQVG
jgi:FemAB-related protein (PEP-CTERM system-associated)